MTDAQQSPLADFLVTKPDIKVLPKKHPKKITGATTLRPYVSEILDGLGHSYSVSRYCNYLIINNSIQTEVLHNASFQFQYQQRFRESSNHVGAFCVPEQNEIYLRRGRFVEVVNYFTHELGHLLKPQIKKEYLEEAKAFAFQFACAEVIRELNVGNLGESIIKEVQTNIKSAQVSRNHRKGLEVIKLLENEKVPYLEMYDRILSYYHDKRL